jgi:hypothetical protein
MNISINIYFLKKSLNYLFIINVDNRILCTNSTLHENTILSKLYIILIFINLIKLFSFKLMEG